jgi:hypothetical protein
MPLLGIFIPEGSHDSMVEADIFVEVILFGDILEIL